MWNLFKNTLLVLVIVVIVAFYFGYQAYDESDVTPGSFSRLARTEIYKWQDKNDPRVILAEDMGIDAFPDDYYLTGLRNEGYKFTSDWFSRKSPAWEVALEPFKGKPDVQYLEVGVYEGRAVAWMLENVLTHPTSHVTGIDIFIGELSQGSFVFDPKSLEIYEHNVRVAGGEGRATTYPEFSQNILRDLPRNYYDIIYIDGGHAGEVVLEDAILAFRLLKVGGIMIFDDYRWFRTEPRVTRPGPSIDIFEEYFGKYFETLHNQAQYILRKTGEDKAAEGLDMSLAQSSET